MFYIEIETPRFLRKPLREGFLNATEDNEEIVRRIIAKYRPKAKIIYLRNVIDKPV